MNNRFFKLVMKQERLVFLNTPEEYGEENSVPGTGFCTIQKPTKEVPKPKPKLAKVSESS